MVSCQLTSNTEGTGSGPIDKDHRDGKGEMGQEPSVQVSFEPRRSSETVSSSTMVGTSSMFSAATLPGTISTSALSTSTVAKEWFPFLQVVGMKNVKTGLVEEGVGFRRLLMEDPIICTVLPFLPFAFVGKAISFAFVGKAVSSFVGVFQKARVGGIWNIWGFCNVGLCTS